MEVKTETCPACGEGTLNQREYVASFEGASFPQRMAVCSCCKAELFGEAECEFNRKAYARKGAE